MDPIEVLWQISASLQPTAKRMEKKYFVLVKGFEFLYTHPPLGSLVVSAAKEWDQQGQHGPTPKAKDAEKLDSFFLAEMSIQLAASSSGAQISKHS